MRSAPPVLLTDADYYGTLAAIRHLGRSGIPVTLAARQWLAPASWSRYVTRREWCPPTREPDRFVEWLLDFGRNNARHVLYPTSDDVAWLLSVHRDDLGRVFHLFQPPETTLRRLLDKRELLDACRNVGLHVPSTYFPQGEADLEAVAAGVVFPVLLKPASQVLLHGHGKGLLVETREDLVAAYRAFRRSHVAASPMAARLAGAGHPMVQRFHPEAADRIYSVAGFVDRGATRISALASRKILQRPRKLGIGLCFEEAPLRQDLCDGIAALCRLVGYHGVFEVEFIETDGRFLLIDFNPRFYSQMAFECGRGLPLPLLAYRAALGLDPLATSDGRCAVSGRVYTHRMLLELLTRGQRLTGRMRAAETARWLTWRRTHRDRMTDAVLDSGDWLPGLVDVLGTTYGYCRHPRSFVRTMLLNE